MREESKGEDSGGKRDGQIAGIADSCDLPVPSVFSKACVKGAVRQVDRVLGSLTPLTAQRRFLHSNIDTRTFDLGGIFATMYTIT